MFAVIAIALALSACNAHDVSNDVNKPLAQAQVPSTSDFKTVNKLISAFAARNHFALQPLISQPQGAVDFSMRLFRDDITVTITRLRGGPIQLAGFPLCACELNRRIGLQSAANSAVDELQRQLSGQ